jgi:hypothetical protein
MGPKTDVISVITSYYEQFVDQTKVLDSPFKDNEGVHFVVSMDHENHGFTKKAEKHYPEYAKRSVGYYHVIILSRRMVFGCFAKTASLHDVPIEDWKNTSNHSSCWKTDGFSEIGVYDFTLFEQSQSKCPKKKRPCYDMSSPFIQLNPLFVGDFIKFVSVTHEPFNQSDPDRRKILNIAAFKMTLSKVE